MSISSIDHKQTSYFAQTACIPLITNVIGGTTMVTVTLDTAGEAVVTIEATVTPTSSNVGPAIAGTNIDITFQLVVQDATRITVTVLLGRKKRV